MPASAMQEDERRRSVSPAPQHANFRASRCYEFFVVRHLIDSALVSLKITAEKQQSYQRENSGITARLSAAINGDIDERWWTGWMGIVRNLPR
jgi:hypothetical protein